MAEATVQAPDSGGDTLSTLLAEVRRLAAALEGPRDGEPARSSYTTEEFGRLVGRDKYTVRLWCLHGRVNAFKAGRWGKYTIWRIPAAELARYRDEGLLPEDRTRNGSTPEPAPTARRSPRAGRRAGGAGSGA
jgi:hypothetical protein